MKGNKKIENKYIKNFRKSFEIMLTKKNTLVYYGETFDFDYLKKRGSFFIEYEMYLMSLCTKILYKYMNDSEMTLIS